ncbi:hypothetical protein [Bradyrhizobium sp. Ec3.3]|uniref:hypothetical protein n=1 Tax=Bradyrhizobium sp. Ec3.3 TaxID=189753 RepID=UPI0003F80890|nr:hypothetical protein [Bradyrhizobium sp. Ec3.3]
MTNRQDTNSTANAAHQETIKPGDPAPAKTPVAALNEALPDDQLDAVSGGAYPLVITTYANTGIGG